MQLVVIGAGPAYTDRRGAAASSYLLVCEDDVGGDAAIVFDLGQGAFANLAATREPSSLRAILVSHLHPDHFVDLVPLRHYLRYQCQPSRRVRVLGPADLAHRLDALNGEDGFAAAALDVEPLAEGVVAIGPFQIEARRVTHSAESYAFRVTAGEGGLVFSGDCGRADDLLPLVRPGDTLLCEASFGAGPVPPGAQHLDGHDAGRIAATAGAGRLLLTHVQMGFDRTDALEAAQAAFDGPTRLVLEGDSFAV